MISVDRIVYDAIQSPALDAQIDHYTRVTRLNLFDMDNQAAYLSSSYDCQRVVLLKGAEEKTE